VWEQVHLPRAARNGLLLNLSGSAPAWSGPQACFMHDAAVFDHPDAYSVTFRSWYRFLFRRLARTARSLFTVSAFSQGRLVSMLGVPASRVHLIPNGADHLSSTVPDPSIVTALGLDQHPFLLAVGSASPTKNVDALVQAWCQLHRPEARLVIVGGVNPVVFARRGIVQAPGVAQLGHLGDAQLKAMYERAAGLVYPSLYEGFGLPPLEAMACGCPVAVSNAASMPEVCGDAALYFDPSSVPEMVDAMRALLDDAALCASLRERGHRRAALFRWDDSAAALLRGLEAAA
jgi:glycosyltransferase involved in cell wall biosynthesis